MNKRSAIRSLSLLFSTLVLARLAAALAPEESERERGDVPGWVMITLMSAVLVAAILAVAEPALKSLFDSAIARVRQ